MRELRYIFKKQPRTIFMKKLKISENTLEEDILRLEQKRKIDGFTCKRCGKCCLSMDHIDIVPEDIARWKKEGRKELFSEDMLAEWDYFGESRLFDNVNTSICPFLIKKNKRYSCKINKTKPLTCRSFPRNRKNNEVIGYGKCKGFN